MSGGRDRRALDLMQKRNIRYAHALRLVREAAELFRQGKQEEANQLLAGTDDES
jgi:hypothetical protein